MFYDKSKWAGEHLTSSWFAGGLLYKTVRSLDVCVGVDSWQEAFEWLANVEPSKKISMIQFWGHGSPGNVWINGDSINNNIIRKDNQYHELALKIRDRLTDDAVIWLRGCSIFQGKKGQTFAKRWTKFWGCTVAAHTYIIGPFQSGLYTLEPGQEPYWDEGEGIDEKGEAEWSRFWKPRTIFCLRGYIPKGW